MSQVVLLGFTLPDDDIAEVTRRSQVLPTQTHNFAWSLVAALRHGGADVRLLSSLPVPDFPAYDAVLVHSHRFRVGDVSGLSMGFVNVLLLKHLTRSVQLLALGRKFVAEALPDALIVHGVHGPYLLWALTRRRRGTRAIAVLTDPPGVILPSDGLVRRVLKRADRAIVRAMLKKFDGVIALSEDLARYYAPGVPTFVTPGFAPTIERASIDANPVPTIAYAGGLSEDYGVKRLVEAVLSITDVDVRLELYGRGELQHWIESLAQTDPRIHFGGALPLDDVRKLLGRADLLVNPRRLDNEQITLSFPSKLLEYVALAVPTITTPIPGIPSSLAQALVVTEDDSADSIRTSILKVIGWGHERRVQFGTSARALAAGQLSPLAQGPAIMRFVAGVLDTAQPRT